MFTPNFNKYFAKAAFNVVVYYEFYVYGNLFDYIIIGIKHLQSIKIDIIRIEDYKA